MKPIHETLNDKQKLALSYYSDPLSETFGNATQSGLRAGLVGLTRSVGWIKNSPMSIHNTLMVKRAERNLKRIIDLSLNVDTKLGVDTAKLQADVSKFVLQNLARGKYNKDSETVTPNVQINIVNYSETKDASVEATYTEA